MIASYKNGMRNGSGRFRVADRGVAARTLEAFGFAVDYVAVDGGGDVFVTVAATALQHELTLRQPV